uniref:Uncharacterized protein n=1 Tax=Anguilla anguilla TaxID=7936 RepID=A0A0E9UB15_ANGAN
MCIYNLKMLWGGELISA